METDSFAFDRRTLRLFEALMDQPPARRSAWLQRAADDDPALIDAVRAMEAADLAADRLPTLPAERGDFEEQPPPARIGHYRIVDEIGRGGMGMVYLGERDDGLFDQTVAIKIIRSARFSDMALARFATERRMLARLEHPGVARLIDGGVTDDQRPWLATEYVEGVTIDRASAGLPLGRRVALLILVAQAVQFAHGRLVAHGDIKPGNIMVGQDGQVKLLDFGIAGLIGEEQHGEAGPLTPDFASPERLGGAPPSTADDVFGLGRTLSVLSADAADAEVAAIAAKAAGSAARRHTSVEAFIADLTCWQQKRPVAAYSRSTSYRLRKYVARHAIGVLAAVVAVTALTATLLAAYHFHRNEETARAVAAARFADAQHASHYMMFDLTDRLERQPGTLRLRAEIYHEAQRYLNEISQAPEAPPAVKLDAVNGYLRAAVVSGLGNAPNLADFAAGKRDLVRADAMLHTLAGDPSLRPTLVPPSVQIASLRCQSKLYGDQDAAGALAEARHGVAQARWLMATAAPTRASLWSLRLCEGDALVWLDRSNEAIALLASELAVARQHGATADPLMTARNLRFLGEAYFYAQRYQQAASTLEEALELFRRERVRSPFRQSAVIEYAGLADDLSSTYTNMSRFGDALRVARDGAHVAEQQAALDADDLQSRRRALSLDRLVEGSLAKLGRYGEAIALADSVDRRWAELVARYRDDAALARYQIMATQVSGDLLREAGRLPEACRVYRQTIAAWDGFGRRWHLAPSDIHESIAHDRQNIRACGGQGTFVDN